jgi:hypothetical protein
MGYNKIPLALGFNDSTGNASGLVEFTLNLSDVGNVCGNEPETGQALVYNSDGEWCPATVGAGSFSGNLSDVGQVCDNQPTNGQALVWSSNIWCPSTIPTGGGGGGAVNSVNNQTGDVSLYLSSLSGIAFDELGGGTGEGDGALPQHVQWNGTNWVNAYEDEQYIRIRNETGSTLVKGQAVFVSASYDNDYPKVGLARADSLTTMPCIGVVYANLNDGESGLAVTFGRADIATGVSMEGSPAEGETVYVSPDTAGRLTADKPTGSTHLIQNVGVVVKDAPGQERIKVTGIGRANDIPNTITLGATTITSASAKFADVQDHSVMITDGTSAVSSLSGASGSIVYFENNPPEPGLKSLADILTNENYDISPGETYLTGVNPPDIGLNSNNEIPYRTGGTTFGAITSTSQGRAFMATNANLVDLTDVNASPAEGAVLQRTGGNTWTHRYFEENSIVITDSASAVSSLSGASGSIVYFEGDAPAPGLQQIGQIMQNAGERVEDHNIEDLANVSQGETPGWPNGCILQYDEEALGGEGAFVSAAIPGIDATDSGSVSIKIDHGAGLSGLGDDDHTQYVLADGTRAISGTLSAIQNDTGLDTVYLYTDASGSEAAPILTFQRDSDNPDDGDYLGQIKFSDKNSNNGDELYAKITGKTSDVTLGTEDGLIEIAVKNAGSNLITARFTGDALKLINGNGLEVEGTLDVTGAASLSSATVATTPTAATDVANKSYVDSQVTTPSYFQALASGTLTLTANATEYDLGWSTSGTYAITDPAGNLEVQDGDSQGNNINVSGDGVYQIDCSVQTTNTTNGGRVGAIIRIYRDTGDGHGFAEISELRASNYASRGIENIVTGTTHLNTLISLNDGDKLKFTIMRNTNVGTPNVTSNGTYLRIIKIA